ncbi:hypothetical protein MBRA_53710 (plasmid) [Mycobacterium branderi]|nr:hypothetical protein MBRA_53710 [Mycobacterium branderi]
MTARRAAVCIAVAGAALVGATITPASPAAHAAIYYGAIAYSSNGSWGRTADWETRQAAEQLAVGACGYTDCKVLSSFTGCGAVANDGRYYQGGVGPTITAAMADAKSRLPGSWIDTWICN